MITDERLKELIDDYGAKLPDDYQNVKNFWNEMKSALSELLTLRQEKRDLIEAIESVRKLDHCVFYDSALSVLKESNPKLAKLIFDTRPEWDFTKWEDV